MLNAAIPATMIALKCPRCGVVQVRARMPSRERYECRHCHAEFTQAQGHARELAQALLAGRRRI